MKRDLERELKRRVRGEVRFDAGSRALYATDASNYRHVPIGVVVPEDVEDAAEAVAVCHRFGAPVLPRGGGTSLAGQCCNVAVVLDLSKRLRAVKRVDFERREAVVEPGVVLDDLRAAAARGGLTFGPDPATHNRCTIGGMIGNNSCGVHSVMAGRMDENVLALEVLTYDGLRLRLGPTSDAELDRLAGQFGRSGVLYARLRSLRDRYAGPIRRRYRPIPRRSSGFNLPALLPENGFDLAKALVGTEGTCALVLGATLRLVPNPPARALLVLGFPDIYEAADRVPSVLPLGPIGLEAMDDRLVNDARKKKLGLESLDLLPEGRGWLLAEFGGGSQDEAVAAARRAMEALRKGGRAPSMELFSDHERQEKIWTARESGLGATAFVPGQSPTWPGWEDSAVPPDKLGDYLRKLRALMDRHGYQGDFYGHFGQGCLHTRIDFDLATKEGAARYRAFVEEAADLAVSYGGSLSGEHGDGQARGELLERMYGPELVAAFREFKAIWDPDGKMNPGKVVDARPLDADLRMLGFHPPEVRTELLFPKEGGFAGAAARCVGVGECRKTSGGVMCPSYMATLEEKHSTRGRARLLFEMLQGDPLKDGWRDRHVFEALELCLACKACKSECPVNVDMASYKAEFLSHYYKGRLRPRGAYAFGLIRYWARLASLAPRLANLAVQTPGLSTLAKRVAGVAPGRELPAFAPRTFRRSFRPRPSAGPRVLLWPDTFNDHFYPDVLEATAEVLRAAGFHVALPPAGLCCGRPLYDYGMLGLARRTLARLLDALEGDIAAGTPLVVCEPSCAAVFRDELVGLFPRDPRSRALAGLTTTLAGFLDGRTRGFPQRALEGRALVQVHCHQRAVLGFEAERRMLSFLGLDAEALDSGCCGMAGAFGFEKGERYEVSMKCAERVLLPAVRAAGPETLILADGFSCREQIRQGVPGRRPLHFAQAARMALRRSPVRI